MDGQIHEWMDGEWIDGLKDGNVDGQIDAQRDEWNT